MEDRGSPSPPPVPSPQDMVQPMDLSHDRGSLPQTQTASPDLSGMKANQVGSVVLHGVAIVSLHMDGVERLCLAQISNTLLKDFSYNEIHNRRVALGITCVQCTPVQLEVLRRAGAMPISSRRCGMITKREAERLVKSFLEEHKPPKLPENFAFQVSHSCGWGCKGHFVPARYNSSRAKCIKCSMCNVFFSPNKFIFHFHRTPESKYRHPDAANFNSWRRHLDLDYGAGPVNEDLRHAWEDVKAMFNGGSRKRLMPMSPTESSHCKSPTSLTDTLEANSCKRMRLDMPDRSMYNSLAGSPPHGSTITYPMPGFGAPPMIPGNTHHYPSLPMLPCPTQPQSSTSMLPRPTHGFNFLDMWRGAQRAGLAPTGPYPSPFSLMWPRTANVLVPPSTKFQDSALLNTSRDLLSMDFALSRRKALHHSPPKVALQSAFRPVGGFVDKGAISSLRHDVADGPAVRSSSPDCISDKDSDDDVSDSAIYNDVVGPDQDIDVCDTVASGDQNDNSYPAMQVMFPGMQSPLATDLDSSRPAEGRDNRKVTERDPSPDKGIHSAAAQCQMENNDHCKNESFIGADSVPEKAVSSRALNTNNNNNNNTLDPCQDRNTPQLAPLPVPGSPTPRHDTTPSAHPPGRSSTLTSVMHMSKEELQAELLRMISARAPSDMACNTRTEHATAHSDTSHCQHSTATDHMHKDTVREKAENNTVHPISDARSRLEQLKTSHSFTWSK